MSQTTNVIFSSIDIALLIVAKVSFSTMIQWFKETVPTAIQQSPTDKAIQENNTHTHPLSSNSCLLCIWMVYLFLGADV